MTINAVSIAALLIPGIVLEVRARRSENCIHLGILTEHEIIRLADLKLIEGVGSSFRLRHVRYVEDSEKFPATLDQVRSDLDPEYTPASRYDVASSREIYRQKLGDGYWAWKHSLNRKLPV